MGRRRKAGPQLPGQYKADIARALRPIKGALTTAKRLGRDVEFMRAARHVVAEGERRVWETKGGAIGHRWKTPMVATGALKRSATTPWLLKVRVTKSRIYFRAGVKYAKFHAHRIYGWDPTATKRLADATGKVLLDLARSEGRIPAR